MIEFFAADCMEILPLLPAGSVDLVVTSPPYNLGQEYGGTCDDDLPYEEYLSWMRRVFCELERVLKPAGSLFLNVGWSPSNPWLSQDVACRAIPEFTLQNRIAWVKSIALGDEPCRGHVKPINSARFLNRQWEEIYHFTRTGETRIERLAVGVPYADPSNLERGTRGKNGNVRCRGDVWFCPYQTTASNADNWHHPCLFPELLVEYCIRLHGVSPGLVLLDPFCGIGTSGVVAKRLGIKALLIDSNPAYIQAAEQRIGAVNG